LKRSLKNLVKDLAIGDLVCVHWCDASIGKSLGTRMNVDVPVESWGVYLGVMGEKTKHIILAQNDFRYADGVFDLDYTAIPLQWSARLTVLAKNHVPLGEAEQMLSSFLMGGRQPLARHKRQRRVTNHHGLD
jgi:hypothetical protein